MIEEYNPWWISKDRIKELEVYRKYEESEVKWFPDVIEKVSLSPYSLNFIFGPRQVGKSTALILLIKKLLDERRVDPKSIFYFSCDKLADYKELDEILGEYIKFRKANNIASSFIFLDEITYPREWYRALKGRIDKGDFKNDVLVVTGSLSMSAKREIETFPGRRGKGKNLLMLPLPFSKYVELFNVKIQKGDLDFVLSNYMRNVQFLSELNELLEKYLITGGFPNAIRDFVKYGKVGENTISDFISSIISDVNKLRRSETFFKLAIKGIIERTASDFSYHTLSRSFGVGTVKTTISYVELLQRLYLLKVLDQIDLEGNVLTRKEKKFYFIDPFIYKAFSFWTLTNLPDETKLIESVVISHLSRIYDTFYIKAKGEIDAVIKSKEEIIGFEVKFGNVKAEKKILGRMKRVYILSKDKVDYNVIPVSIFLAMIDIPQSIELKVLI
ncbi:ATP-binding protein [Saccharolobus caldissimus]|uniref:ATPase AAA n=1 Tax=Saccharolobus caldissimus TaxID=1702097 RepID=A0AAQ4CVZ8_9CREN|nr:ATP-binding protein [Saccharolobus caldissimus]BDB99979.1 ATPase AAA [Saccharolobus caldissimus]